MPEFRSVFRYGVLAACLAQAWAGPQYGGDGEGWSSWDGGKGDHGQNQKNQDVSPQQCGDMMTTVTVTAVAPCTATSVVTAYMTVYTSAEAAASSSVPPPPPPGPPGPPGWPAPGEGPQPNGEAPIMTTAIPDFHPGLSSIPAQEALVTGVTMAAAAQTPPAAAAAAASTSDSWGAYEASSSVAALPAVTGSGDYSAWSSSTSDSAAPAPTMPAAAAAAPPSEWPAEEASSFTTTGTISPGLSSIPNTDVEAPTPVAAAATTISHGNAGTLGIGNGYQCQHIECKN